MTASGIYARKIPEQDYSVQIGLASGRLVSLECPDTPDPGAETEHALLDRLEEYLTGTEMEFSDVAIALTVPTDQRAILETLREVPYGEQITRAELAAMTPGLETDDGVPSVVDETLSSNPIPIILPDHRIEDGRSTLPAPIGRHLREIEGLQ